MAVTVAQAPIAFCAGLTSVAGTSQQIFQVSTAGVTAGLTAGNLYLNSPSSNTLNGKRFSVVAAGWVKAHGATQTIAPEIQIFPWNTSVAGAKTVSGTATFTAVASAALTAGTYYNFLIKQDFVGSDTQDTLTGFPAIVYVGTAAVSVTVGSSVTVDFSTASQTEPITGINASTNYPLASFAVSFANSVSDTTETALLTDFHLEL